MKTYDGKTYNWRVGAGAQTFFFDVKQSRTGLQLSITQTRRKEDGFERSRVVVPKEKLGDFVRGLLAAARAAAPTSTAGADAPPRRNGRQPSDRPLALTDLYGGDG